MSRHEVKGNWESAQSTRDFPYQVTAVLRFNLIAPTMTPSLTKSNSPVSGERRGTGRRKTFFPS
jgi:hypothetical protein